jgi:DNA-directed RNA polymerase subunit RPC12/RpoP
VNLKLVVGIPVVAVLFFFGIIFAIASSVDQPLTRLAVAAMCFILGFGIVYYIARRPPTPIVQKLEVSGDMKAIALKCPNCSATVDSTRIRIVSGVPYATCPYCGHTFEVTEEPKW